MISQLAGNGTQTQSMNCICVSTSYDCKSDQPSLISTDAFGHVCDGGNGFQVTDLEGQLSKHNLMQSTHDHHMLELEQQLKASSDQIVVKDGQLLQLEGQWSTHQHEIAAGVVQVEQLEDEWMRHQKEIRVSIAGCLCGSSSLFL